MKNFFNHKLRKRSTIEIVFMVLFGIVAITGLAILFGFILMWLWNWLMPEIFGLPFITYWQAVGLFIISKVFIGGCGSGGGSSRKNKECKDDSNKNEFSKWKHYGKFWEEKGEDMYAEYVDKMDNNSSESTENKVDKLDNLDEHGNSDL